MSNLNQIQTQLRNLHSFLKEKNATINDLQLEWYTRFGQPLSEADAEYFLQHYREMYQQKAGRRTYRGKRRNQRKTRVARKKRTLKRGGSLSGAPLTYAMTPGTMANVYGRFPTEIATDPASLKNLDQFYNSGLSRGCGIENSTRQVPANLGSNQVGGRTRRKRGGSLLESMNLRGFPFPYYATPPPNFLQTTSGAMDGVKPFVSGAPEVPAWSYSSLAPNPINPAYIAPIQGTFNTLAYSDPLRVTVSQ